MKRSRVGTVNPPAPLRDNKGWFISGSKQKPLATSGAIPTILIGKSVRGSDKDPYEIEDSCENDSGRGWSSDLIPVPGSSEPDKGENEPTEPTRPDRVQVVMYAKSPGSSNMDVGPSPKRQRTASTVSSVKETILLLNTLRWVHDTMKSDLNEAYSKTAPKFANCCNWWYRAIM